MDPRHEAYRLFRIGKLQESMAVCEKYPLPECDLVKLRCRTRLHQLEQQKQGLQEDLVDLDIIDTSAQKSLQTAVALTSVNAQITSRHRTAAVTTAKGSSDTNNRMKTAARLQTARKSLTRQAMTARRTTAAVRQTANRMKTAANRKQTANQMMQDGEEDTVDQEIIEQFPQLAYDYFIATMQYRRALDISSSFDQSRWWYLQKVRAMFMLTDYKGCLEALRAEGDEFEYVELLMRTHCKLGLSMPELQQQHRSQLDILVLNMKLTVGRQLPVDHQIYSDILALDNSNSDALLGLAIHHFPSAPEIAMHLFLRIWKKQSLNGQTNTAKLLCNIGLSAFNCHALDIAALCLENALKQDFDQFDSDLYSTIASLFIQTGDFVTADLCYALGSMLSQLDPRALNNWAILRDFAKDFDGAREQWQKAITLLEFTDGTDESRLLETIISNGFLSELKQNNFKQCLVYAKQAQFTSNQLLKDRLRFISSQ